MPDPLLREDDVLVQIHAASVNLLDSKIRDGEFKFADKDALLAEAIHSTFRHV
jgi:NADPH:quinone reductase-like Zn-dependent oxidoreductase